MSGGKVIQLRPAKTRSIEDERAALVSDWIDSCLEAGTDAWPDDRLIAALAHFAMYQRIAGFAASHVKEPARFLAECADLARLFAEGDDEER